MTTSVPPKTEWVQKLNYIKNLSLKPLKLSGQGLKTLAYLGALIYWGILILGTFSLLN